MLLILLYILLAVCICGLCIIIRCRGRCNVGTGGRVNPAIYDIISSLDEVIVETEDRKLKKRLIEIRDNAARLITEDAESENIPTCTDKSETLTSSAQAMPRHDINVDIFESVEDSLVVKAVKYVEAKMHNPELSVELLSEHLGVSRVHLYNKIKASTQMTPIEFIRLIRLQRGARMLREGGMTVSEVAEKVGFNSPRNFSKYFKDEFGMLPSAYQLQT